MQMVPKIEARFQTFLLPPPVKIRVGISELSGSNNKAPPTTKPGMHLMGGLFTAAESRVQVKKTKYFSVYYGLPTHLSGGLTNKIVYSCSTFSYKVITPVVQLKSVG